jgi:hypothetical protein
MLQSVIDDIRVNYLFNIAPEFITTDTVKLSTINFNIISSSLVIKESLYKDNYYYAIAYLTAHKLTVFNPTSIDVSLLKNKVGSISKERKKWDKVEKETFYGSSTNNSSKSTNTDYNTTVYGQEYWNLRQLVKPISVFLA